MLKVKLGRDLRKQLLRGHPWVYSQSVDNPPKVREAQLCEVLDKKGQFVVWGIYDPHSPLVVRSLSTEKKPPNKSFFEKRFSQSLELRKNFFSSETNSFRLFNGEGDRLPGLVCDIYDKVAVIQFDGEGPFQFWDQEFIAEWLLENTLSETVVYKPRFSDKKEPIFWGKRLESEVIEIKENGRHFLVNIIEGQKTGFFLDQRDNRLYVSQLSKESTVLNLFSYSGGFSIYAGSGGAQKVTSVDISQGALSLADEAWKKTGLNPEQHESCCEDVFKFIETESRKWSLVVVDPPSMTHSEKQKAKAVKAYVDLFSQSLRLVEKCGDICFSSCSSHISFEDFFDIINESLSKSRKTGRIHRISGQGVDHPFPHSCHEMRYLKFVHVKLDS